MRKIKEVLRLNHEHVGNREIARRLNISAGSVSNYLTRAKAAGLVWPLNDDWSEDKIYSLLFPAENKKTTHPLPDFGKVHQELKRKGVTLLLLWYEYQQQNPGGYSYSRYCELYQAFIGKCNPSMRLSHRAGEKLFVDYSGLTVSWTDKATGEIHKTAIVHPTAKIGENCSVGPYTVIGKNVEIGANTVIGANVTIQAAHIGKDCIIHTGVRIGQDGFGFAMGAGGHIKVPQLGGVVIGDDVEIGANTCIDRGSGPNTIIGDGTKIDNLVQIGHNVEIGKYCVIVAQVGIAGSTKLADYAVIGGQAGLSGHIKIGVGAKIAAGSGVIKDVEAGKTVGGLPAVNIRDWHKATLLIEKMVNESSKN